PREEWPNHRGGNTPIAKKIAAVLALEAEGARVRAIAVPLTDREQLQRTVDELRCELGPIGGVIHNAGTLDRENPAFVRKSLAAIERVLAPKVAGLESLLECIAGDPLQFVLLHSSVSAIVPDLAVGQADYAMANAYMDYVAQRNAAEIPLI